jgi:hypothetical protein
VWKELAYANRPNGAALIGVTTYPNLEPTHILKEEKESFFFHNILRHSMEKKYFHDVLLCSAKTDVS